VFLLFTNFATLPSTFWMSRRPRRASLSRSAEQSTSPPIKTPKLWNIPSLHSKNWVLKPFKTRTKGSPTGSSKTLLRGPFSPITIIPTKILLNRLILNKILKFRDITRRRHQRNPNSLQFLNYLKIQKNLPFHNIAASRLPRRSNFIQITRNKLLIKINLPVKKGDDARRAYKECKKSSNNTIFSKKNPIKNVLPH